MRLTTIPLMFNRVEFFWELLIDKVEKIKLY